MKPAANWNRTNGLSFYHERAGRACSAIHGAGRAISRLPGRRVRQTIATVLGLGLSGEPYSGPDTGGFTNHPSPELYVRWFQLDSFLPVFRTHCAFYLPQREPWEFGPQALEILRAQLELRYKLMPYWYTLAWKASQTGEPLVRPLFWNEPENKELWKIDDEFMAGDAFLVAPVLAHGARKAFGDFALGAMV